MGEINKARYWVAICYPENMKEDWQECIGDLIEYPYCYCIHDKDPNDNNVIIFPTIPKLLAFL